MPARDVAIYVRNAKQSIVFNTAARAWACGVPWAEALKISQQAMAKAGSGAPKASKGKAKGKGKGRGKAPVA